MVRLTSTKLSFLSSCRRAVGDACWWDNGGTTAAAVFLHRSKCWGGRSQWTKASYGAPVERSPRAGPMGDIFSEGAHSLEGRFTTPNPHFFSVCLGRCKAGAGLFLSLPPFLSGVGVEFILPKHVFLILGPVVWKLFDSWISFHSRLDALPPTWSRLSLVVIFALEFRQLVDLFCVILIIGNMTVTEIWQCGIESNNRLLNCKPMT